MYTATLSEKFQICIPKALRKELNLRAGEQFIFIAKGSILYLVPKISAASARGMLKGASPTQYRDREDRA